jgi:hypothetical protein
MLTSPATFLIARAPDIETLPWGSRGRAQGAQPHMPNPAIKPRILNNVAGPIPSLSGLSAVPSLVASAEITSEPSGEAEATLPK